MMRVSAETRNEMIRIATEEYGGSTLEETLRRLLDEHRRARWVQAAREYFAEPDNHDDYLGEAREWEAIDEPTTDR